MKTGKLTLAILISLSFSASAMPISRPSCAQSRFEKTYGAFIQKVNQPAQEDDNGVVQFTDPRNLLEVLAPKWRWTPSEVKKVRKATGYVDCRGTEFGNRGASTGVLFGNGGQLLTATHDLIDKNGNLRGPCFFQNQDSSGNIFPVELVLSSIEVHNQIAIVSLKSKIPGVTGFPIAQTPIAKNKKMWVVSAAQKDLKKFEGQPIGQSCKNIDELPAVGDSGRELFGDCTILPGGSGSVGFVRENGVLSIAAIMTGGGLGKNNIPYSLDPDKQSFSHGVAVDGNFANQVMAYESTHGPQNVQAPLPNKVSSSSDGHEI